VEHNGVMDAVARDLRTLFGPGVLGALSDAQLLRRFVERREGDVFEAIIRRHGPMVWGVCRRVLRDHHDAEDAFQATFLVLARRSASVIPREKLGNWLYGVAYQTAMKARAQRTKRQTREAQVSDAPEPVATPNRQRDELAESLDRELNRLPERYRTPIVLCDLEGWTHQEAASQLGWPVGTVSSRLSRGRAMLARRLSREGVSLSAGSLVVFLSEESASAAMPAQLIGPTAQAASLFAVGGAAVAGVAPAKVGALTGEVMKLMLLSKIKVITVMVLVTSALVAGGTRLAYRAQGGEPTSQTEAPGAKGQDQGVDDLIAAKNREEQLRKTADLTSPPLDSPGEPLKLNAPPETPGVLPPPQLPPQDFPPKEPPLPPPATAQVVAPEDPLAELIMTSDHTPEQLARAKELIESMITLDKEAQGKSPEEINKMIEGKASALEKARWDIRVMDAQLRRLQSIKQKTHGPVAETPTP